MSIYPRTRYEMTEEDLAILLHAMRSDPVMKLGEHWTGEARERQERANAAWKALGDKLHFDHMTVEPIEGMGNRFFTAVPSENDEQKKERMAREAEHAKEAEIARLHREKAAIDARLFELQKPK